MSVKKLIVSIVGGVALLFILIYLVTPFFKKQFYSMGANNQIKKDERCVVFKDEYVNSLINKSDVSSVLDIAKKDNCRK